MRIGFVGTGTMGTPIAGCLIRAGHVLSVFDCRHNAARGELELFLSCARTVMRT